MVKIVNFDGLSDIHIDIMNFIDDWARTKKTPIPLTEIKKNIASDTIKEYKVVNSITLLLKKGYIRRAVSMSNKTYYVQLRRV